MIERSKIGWKDRGCSRFFVNKSTLKCISGSNHKLLPNVYLIDNVAFFVRGGRKGSGVEILRYPKDSTTLRFFISSGVMARDRLVRWVVA